MPEPTPLRVLLVDDQPLFRGAIAALIERQPDMVVVGEAENGLEGVEKALTLHPDLVVMDVEMPVMNGVEAVRPHPRAAASTPRSSCSRCPRPTTTSSTPSATAAHGYLLKDLRPDQFYDMIRAVMRNETPISPAVAGRLLAEIQSGNGQARRLVGRTRGPARSPGASSRSCAWWPRA